MTTGETVGHGPGESDRQPKGWIGMVEVSSLDRVTVASRLAIDYHPHIIAEILVPNLPGHAEIIADALNKLHVQKTGTEPVKPSSAQDIIAETNAKKQEGQRSGL